MKTKALTAAQIDTLAQRLSETSIKPATSAKKAGDNFARLPAARIGEERAALAFTPIQTAATADQAEARLTLVLDYGTTDPAGETIRAAEKEAKAAPTPVVGRPSSIWRRAAPCRRPQISPGRPTPGSAPSWPRSWPWLRRATLPVCRLSRSTRSQAARRRWPATATFA